MQRAFVESGGYLPAHFNARTFCSAGNLQTLGQCSPQFLPHLQRCGLKPLIVQRPRISAMIDGKQAVEIKISENNIVEKAPQDKCKQSPHAGSVLGAIALITGSSVGAGMLAMPAATAAAGFIPSAALMTGSWGLLTLEALLLVEVNLAVAKALRAKGENLDSIVSLRSMAAETLGPFGAQITSSVYLFMSYTLLVAFVSKGGEVLNLLSSHAIPASAGGLAFAAGMGALVTFGSSKTVDFTNQILTATLLVLFGGLLVGGTQVAQWNTLVDHHDWAQVGGAIPIVFLSLVFHDLTPYLCKYLGFDKGRIQTAVVVGGSIPLFMFLAWNAVALAAVPDIGGALQSEGIVDPIRILIETQGGFASLAIEIFSMLAIVTSFIGTSLGLSEHMLCEVREYMREIPEGHQVSEWLAKQLGSGANEDACKGFAVSLSLIPPSIAAFMNPQLFFIASQMAGAYGITLLYGIIPPLMAWQMRHPPEGEKFRVKKPMVPGGKPVLASLASFAAAVEVGKFATDSGAFLSGLSAVGTQVQSAANLVITGIASADNMSQIGQAFQLHNM